MSSLAQRSARAAAKAVNAAVRDAYDRKRFTIARFGRHRDGYLHALIEVDGERRFYFHLRYGSWLAPGQFNGQERLKEPEALLGTQLGQAVKYELSDMARKFHPTPEREEEAHGPEGGDSTVPDAGVPEGGDRDDAPGGVQAVA